MGVGAEANIKEVLFTFSELGAEVTATEVIAEKRSAWTHLIQGRHQLLVNNHLADESVHVAVLQLKHLAQDWLSGGIV